MRRYLRFLSGAVVGIALTAAVFGGVSLVHARDDAAPSAGLWADGCVFMVNDDSYAFNLPYGSVKFVGGFVANYDGRYLPDYNARQAMAAFDCRQVY
jgi:hypothetical protein